MKITLTEEAGRWSFVDNKGRRVRVEMSEPSSFATEAEAVAAAERHGLAVVASRLVVS